MTKKRELGVLSVDTGDVVCFSMDSVLDMAESLGEHVHQFIRKYKGIPCQFGADGGYAVDRLTAVQKDGSTYDIVTIGGDAANMVRFLQEDEPTFAEFYRSHPKYSMVGKGNDFNVKVFEEIKDEYRRKLQEFPNLTGA